MTYLRVMGVLGRLRTNLLGLFCAGLVIAIYVVTKVFKIPNYDSIGDLPYKDAIAWNLCARSLAENGNFPDGEGNWCYRRPLFSELLGVLFRALDSNLLVLGFMTITFAVVLYFFVRELSYWTNPIGVLGISLFLIFIWSLFGNNLFLSEALAIPLGVLFAVTVLSFLRRRSFQMLIWMAILYSTLQNLRPSNFFLLILPLMLSVLYKEKLLHVTYIALASILPFLAVRITGKLLQIREYNNAGNAWSTLYGLINGNADWRLAYSNLRRSGEPSDYEASLEIRQMALEGFRNDPLQAMKSVAINVFQMLTGNHPFFLPDNFSAGLLGIVFSIFLLFLLLIAIRSSFRFNSGSNCRIPWVYCYILLTTLISYGIFWKSEASRVMTTSLPILAALTLIVIRPRRLANISGNRRVTIRTLVPPLLFVITLPTLIILNHSVGDHLQKNLTRQCSGQQFYFVPRTITSQDVELVKKFGLFEWESSIESLDTGFLVIGVGRFGDSLKTVRLFLQDPPKLEECYEFHENKGSGYAYALEKLGFREAIIYSF